MTDNLRVVRLTEPGEKSFHLLPEAACLGTSGRPCARARLLCRRLPPPGLPWHHGLVLTPALPSAPRIHSARVAAQSSRGCRQSLREVGAGAGAQSDRVSSASGGDPSPQLPAKSPAARQCDQEASGLRTSTDSGALARGRRTGTPSSDTSEGSRRGGGLPSDGWGRQVQVGPHPPPVPEAPPVCTGRQPQSVLWALPRAQPGERGRVGGERVGGGARARTRTPGLSHARAPPSRACAAPPPRRRRPGDVRLRRALGRPPRAALSSPCRAVPGTARPEGAAGPRALPASVPGSGADGRPRAAGQQPGCARSRGRRGGRGRGGRAGSRPAEGRRPGPSPGPGLSAARAPGPPPPPPHHGGDQDHLSHGRGGDAVPGQAARGARARHAGRLQERAQQPAGARLQILLQVHGPGLRVSGPRGPRLALVSAPVCAEAGRASWLLHPPRAWA